MFEFWCLYMPFISTETKLLGSCFSITMAAVYNLSCLIGNFNLTPNKRNKAHIAGYLWLNLFNTYEESKSLAFSSKTNCKAWNLKFQSISLMPELDFTILLENLFFFFKQSCWRDSFSTTTSFSNIVQARSLRLFLGALLLRQRLGSHNSSISLGPRWDGLWGQFYP